MEALNLRVRRQIRRIMARLTMALVVVTAQLTQLPVMVVAVAERTPQAQTHPAHLAARLAMVALASTHLSPARQSVMRVVAAAVSGELLAANMMAVRQRMVAVEEKTGTPMLQKLAA